MPKLLPHVGGNTQTIIHRVRTMALDKADCDFGKPQPVLTEDDFHATAIYHAEIEYDQPYHPAWRFTDGR